MTPVQRLDADDWAAWRAMRLRALAEDPGSFAASSAAWTGDDDVEERWRGRVASARACFLAHRRGEPVGMVALDEDPGSDDLVLASMWVAADARRAGVGRALVAAVLASAEGRAVRLRVVDGNAAAVGTYLATGFVPLGDGVDAEGCVAMRRPAPTDQENR